MVMNANVVRREFAQGDERLCLNLSIPLHRCACRLGSSLDENSLLRLDLCLLASGFLVLLLTEEKMLSLSLLLRYFINISFFTTGLYIFAPVYQTLISSDSICAVTVFLLLLHLFLHDYSGSTIRALKTPKLTSCISLNASIVAPVFIASRFPSRLHVFAVMLFSLQVFLFAPLVTCCIKKFSFGLHFFSLLFSIFVLFLPFGVLVNIVSLFAH